MSDWIAAVGAVLTGTVLFVFGAGLLVSLPVVAARAAQVIARREWVPLSYSVRSLVGRKVATASTFVVMVLVVFALTGAMMLAQGIAHTLTATGDPLNVKVLRGNSASEWVSWLSQEQVKVIAAAPGVARGDSGRPLVSAEMVVLIWARREDASDPDAGANVTVRGVHPVAFDVHRATLRAGRHFTTGTHEIVIGKALAGRFSGAAVGGVMSFAEREWTVVGVADHGGSAADSEIWGDVEVMGPAFRRGYSTATLALTESAGLDAVSAELASQTDSRELVVKREQAYWRALSENYVGFVRVLGAAVALIFSFGAILGALNTMYAQVAARTRELGALRAIGFKPKAILVSLVLESVLLAVSAGVVGVSMASLLSQLDFRLTSAHTLSEITYRFQLSPAIVAGSIGFAALMGYAGGLLPALRAARMTIVDAVRAD